MTLAQFITTYRFNILEQRLNNNTYQIITQVINRNNGAVVDGIGTTLDIGITRDIIEGTHSPLSINQLDWVTIIDTAKRSQMDFFARIIPISDFFPLNKETDIVTVTQ